IPGVSTATQLPCLWATGGTPAQANIARNLKVKLLAQSVSKLPHRANPPAPASSNPRCSPAPRSDALHQRTSLPASSVAPTSVPTGGQSFLSKRPVVLAAHSNLSSDEPISPARPDHLRCDRPPCLPVHMFLSHRFPRIRKGLHCQLFPALPGRLRLEQKRAPYC